MSGRGPPEGSAAAYAGASRNERKPDDAPPGYWDLFSPSNKDCQLPSNVLGPGSQEVHFRFSQKSHCVLYPDGVLSYDPRSIKGKLVPVALLVTSRRIGRDYSNYLEIEILDAGQKGCLSVGIVPPDYGSSDWQPGWGPNSVGYHADDGGIFFESPTTRLHTEKCTVGDRMGVEVIYPPGSNSSTPLAFFFTKNGKEVCKRRMRNLVDGSHYLAVGMHSLGEKVRLLESDMWKLPSEDEPKPQVVSLPDARGVSVTRHCHFSQMKYCKLSPDGLLRNIQTGYVFPRVSLLTTQRLIRPSYNNYIEIEIVAAGEKCQMSVGIIPPNYSSFKQPGWELNSVGYHADDGGIFNGTGKANIHVATCGVGDRMGVGVTFPRGDSVSNATPMFFFTKNGKQVIEMNWEALGNGPHHLVVGMRTKGEAVRLMDSEMWLSDSEALPAQPSAPPYTQPSAPIYTPGSALPSAPPNALSNVPCEEAPPRYEDVAKSLPNPVDDCLPGFWDLSAGKDNGSYRLIPITKTGGTYHEYEKIEMQFFETLSRDQIRILKIQRIQNPDLYRVFQSCKQKMGKQSATGAVEEKLLFHGAKQEYIEAICQQGFDSHFSGDSMAFQYGRGSYFAKEADYSRHYTDSQQLFVARVLVGHYTKGEPFHEQPPPKDPEHSHGEAFDSCVDDVDNPKVFVVYSIEQAYPEYLVDFQEV